jgi:hypothetical protein
MDATRPRRTKDRSRQLWYAGQRRWRFARFMGVIPPRSDDETRRDGLLAVSQQTSRAIHGPGDSAWIVALHSNALATGERARIPRRFHGLVVVTPSGDGPA